jgi:hypothetical protein
MSAGAWMGFISLIHRPHYWAKTEHGLSLPMPGTVPVMATPRRDT